ncbi:MAG: S1 RNA-binding domain-containing protein, partial [Pacificimonas sp.]
DTVDRYVASYLAEREGDTVTARVTGVTRHGIFATVDGVGGDGLLPMRALGDDYYEYDEPSRTITGERGGETFSIGQRLDLRLQEANPVTGGLVFARADGDGTGNARPSSARRKPPRGKHKAKKLKKAKARKR